MCIYMHIYVYIIYIFIYITEKRRVGPIFLWNLLVSGYANSNVFILPFTIACINTAFQKNDVSLVICETQLILVSILKVHGAVES